MAFDKNNMKKYILSAIIFGVGMLSVSVSNIFGGYYCSVAVIETILYTMFVYGMFDRNENLKENAVLVALISCVTFSGLLFFVVNDIFNVNVYVKNVLDFWGICVISSQLLSMASIVYIAVYLVLSLNKNKVELVEDYSEDTQNVEHEEVKQVEETVGENKDVVEKEVKSITHDNISVDVPYMEEEN